MKKIYIAPIGRPKERVRKGISKFNPDIVYFIISKEEKWDKITDTYAHEIKWVFKASEYMQFINKKAIISDYMDMAKTLVSIIRETEKKFGEPLQIFLDVTGLPRDVSIELAIFAYTQYGAHIIMNPTARDIDTLNDEDIRKIAKDEGTGSQELIVARGNVLELIGESEKKIEEVEDPKKRRDMKASRIILEMLYKCKEEGNEWVSASFLIDKMAENKISLSKRRIAALAKQKRLADKLEKVGVIETKSMPGSANEFKITVTGERIAKIYLLGP